MNSDECNSQGRCPFLKKPEPECYCVDLTSQDIISVLYFCGSNFKQCRIYKELMEKEAAFC